MQPKQGDKAEIGTAGSIAFSICATLVWKLKNEVIVEEAHTLCQGSLSDY